MSARLLLTLDRPDASVENFAEAAQALVAVVREVASAIDNEVRGTLKSFGAVEGVLLMVSKRDGYRFSVEDRLRGVRVECRFGDALLPEVLAAFEKRVSVRGVVWSRRDGQPTLVEVKAFEVLEDDARLPRAWEVRGILREISYSAEYD